MLAGTLRPNLAATGAHHLYVEVVIMEVCIEQRNIQILALSCAITIKQGARDSSQRVYTRRDIAHCQHWRIMGAALLAAQPGDSGISLADVIIARIIGQGPMLSER